MERGREIKKRKWSGERGRGRIYSPDKSRSIFGPDKNTIVGTNLILRDYTL